MRKNYFIAVAAALTCAGMMSAQEMPMDDNAPAMPPPPEMMMPPPEMMAPPDNNEGEPQMGRSHMLNGMSREEQAGFAQFKQRRHEIMMLIQAYKILPPEQQETLKPEILQRMKADYAANLEHARKMVTKMEERVARIKAKIAEDEAKSDEKVNIEFNKLLNMKMMSHNGMMANPEMMPPDGKPRQKADMQAQLKGENSRDNQNDGPKMNRNRKKQNVKNSPNDGAGMPKQQPSDEVKELPPPADDAK